MSWGCTLHCNHPILWFFLLFCSRLSSFLRGHLWFRVLDLASGVHGKGMVWWKALWGSHVLWQHLAVAVPSDLLLGHPEFILYHNSFWLFSQVFGIGCLLFPFIFSFCSVPLTDQEELLSVLWLES